MVAEGGLRFGASHTEVVSQSGFLTHRVTKQKIQAPPAPTKHKWGVAGEALCIIEGLGIWADQKPSARAQSTSQAHLEQNEEHWQAGAQRVTGTRNEQRGTAQAGVLVIL